ncbi:MAG: type I methionyl aminopeptidase [Patescibacteria group bacterium]|nr:MAG: type I methionyl aminopeptidase [Patescibacteria group bacterium]
MHEGGKITAAALEKVLKSAILGISLRELEEVAREEITRLGGEPAFQRVRGYEFATCLNVNEGVVHGLPTGRKLAEGDLFSADLGTYYKGFNTDSSWTVRIGGPSAGSSAAPQVEFLRSGEEALKKAIAQARVGRRVADISRAMQEVLERKGYRPIDSLVGHGIGRELHEDPQIPCLVRRGRGPELAEGMTLAIEVIYTEGDSRLQVEKDGWTISTADGRLSGLFEHTIAVTDGGPVILTQR